MSAWSKEKYQAWYQNKMATDPEWRKKRSASSWRYTRKKLAADPEFQKAYYKKKADNRRARYHSNPEFRKKCIERSLAHYYKTK